MFREILTRLLKSSRELESVRKRAQVGRMFDRRLLQPFKGAAYLARPVRGTEI
jgi:hypothetical protein